MEYLNLLNTRTTRCSSLNKTGSFLSGGEVNATKVCEGLRREFSLGRTRLRKPRGGVGILTPQAYRIAVGFELAAVRVSIRRRGRRRGEPPKSGGVFSVFPRLCPCPCALSFCVYVSRARERCCSSEEEGEEKSDERIV